MVLCEDPSSPASPPLCLSSGRTEVGASSPRQIQNPLGDDVEHDFARPAFDRIGLGAQPAARAGAALGLFAVPFERFAAAARHDEFVAALVEFGRSEEHTSELQSLMRISYAVFCLKKKKATKRQSYPLAR